jgi:hypothetical protein
MRLSNTWVLCCCYSNSNCCATSCAHFVVALGSPVLELEPVAVVDLEPAVVVLLLLCGQNTAFNILTFVIVIIVIENIWHVALLPKSLPNRAAAPTTLKKFV